MAAERRRSAGPRFGDGGGTNVADYLGLLDGGHAAEPRPVGGDGIVDVRVDQIDRSPYQVRVDFDAGELEALGEDIDANGLHHPVTLRAKRDGRYELLAGERRWLAVRALGRESVTARIRDVDDFDAHLVGVSENNQRADLSPWERALEASELQRHATASGRPHAQRDLARYLGRNVATVNQQLAIADAITAELLVAVKVDARDVCTLPHEALHRIARLASADRAHALAAAVRKRVRNGAAAQAGKNDRGGTERAEPVEAAVATPANVGPAKEELTRASADRWTSLWERGGFHVHIRKPLRDVDPEKARKYLEDLLPGIGGLAIRATQGNGPDARDVTHWESEHGRLVFVPPLRALTPERRDATKAMLGRLAADLDTAIRGNDPVRRLTE